MELIKYCINWLFKIFCRDWRVTVDIMEHFPIPAWLWEKRDTRMDGLPLLNSPLPAALICMCYVFIVKVAGPRFMQNREPYNIKKFLVIYNALQVALSAYIVYWVSLQILNFRSNIPKKMPHCVTLFPDRKNANIPPSQKRMSSN